MEVLTKSQTLPHRDVQRARVLLLAGDGVANASIVTAAGLSAATVLAWRRRFEEEGLAKLGKVRCGRGSRRFRSRRSMRSLI